MRRLSKLLRVANNSYSPPVISAIALVIFFFIAFLAIRRVPMISAGASQIRLIPVNASLSVQNLRERWRECQCVYHGVAIPDGSHHVISLGDMTSMITIFAYQEDRKSTRLNS